MIPPLPCQPWQTDVLANAGDHGDHAELQTPWKTIAVAKKLARIIWGMLSRSKGYRATA